MADDPTKPAVAPTEAELAALRAAVGCAVDALAEAKAALHAAYVRRAESWAQYRRGDVVQVRRGAGVCDYVVLGVSAESWGEATYEVAKLTKAGVPSKANQNPVSQTLLHEGHLLRHMDLGAAGGGAGVAGVAEEVP